MPDPIRVRFAPSPTGYLHVGGARTALFNWLVRPQAGRHVRAAHRGHRPRAQHRREHARDPRRAGVARPRLGRGAVIYQGDDLDAPPARRASACSPRARRTAASAPRRSSTAKREAARRREYPLRPHAAPRSRREETAARARPRASRFTIRFRVPDGHDRVGRHGARRHRASRTRTSTTSSSCARTARRSTTWPSSRTTSTMRITHVIRGDDHISNTPKQILLYQALRRAGPRVRAPAHDPRHGREEARPSGTAPRRWATTRSWAILPRRCCNFLALLGWSPGDEREVMTWRSSSQRSRLERVQQEERHLRPGEAGLDERATTWTTQVRRTELLPLVAPLLIEEGLITEAEVEDRRGLAAAPAGAAQGARAQDGGDPRPGAHLLWRRGGVRSATPWPSSGRTPPRPTACWPCAPRWRGWSRGRVEAIEAGLRAAAEGLGVGFGKVAQPLRVALTGSAASPGNRPRGLPSRDASADAARRIDRARERMSTKRGVGTLPYTRPHKIVDFHWGAPKLRVEARVRGNRPRLA